MHVYAGDKKNSTPSEILMSVVITCGEMLTYRNTVPYP
jgi:hypothetical protein